MKATADLMDMLHGALAERFRDRLLDTENPVTAAEMNVIRQFLKDNNIDSVPRKNNPLEGLVKALPFPIQQDVDGTVN